MSALVEDENFGHRNVHLRGWQRADLSDGEEAMMAERRETPFVVEAMAADLSGPKAGLTPAVAFDTRIHICRLAFCSFILPSSPSS